MIDCTRRFDGVELTPETLRVSDEELDRAGAGLDDGLRRALDTALANIRRFHETQLPRPLELLEVADGIWCGERTTAIDSACLYVPRGRGAFASVAAMLGVPARVAGVERVIVCTPPGPDGTVDAATLYVTAQLGIRDVFRVGGAQAIAAVAHGTESIPACDKVVGPGNVWVSAARELLRGTIDTGPPAGPSESLILADGAADPRNVAWNLMIEAEHGENSTALLVTDCPRLAEEVARTVGSLVSTLTAERRAFVTEVLAQRGGVLVADTLDDAIDFANRFGSEHLALMVAEPWSLLPRIRHAGEILLGDYPIMSLANYAMGINAILPTGGRARTWSGISVRDFTKRTSIGFVTREGYRALRDVVPALSRDEGFSAHHEAVLDWNEPGIRSKREKESS